jgi:hypothetical protein
LKPKVKEHPEISLHLADLLWREGWLECRMIAFAILGWIHPSPSERIKDRLIRWCQVCGGDQVMDEILAEQLVVLWKKSPDLLMTLIDFWLSSSDPASRKWGLRIIPFLAKDPSFNNLPIIFRLLNPFVQDVKQVPNSDLVAAVRGLAKYAPQETSYFLQRSLTTSENPGVYALIRQSMDVFSPSTQGHLRGFLREMRELFDQQ